MNLYVFNLSFSNFRSRAVHFWENGNYWLNIKSFRHDTHLGEFCWDYAVAEWSKWFAHKACVAGSSPVVWKSEILRVEKLVEARGRDAWETGRAMASRNLLAATGSKWEPGGPARILGGCDHLLNHPHIHAKRKYTSHLMEDLKPIHT